MTSLSPLTKWVLKLAIVFIILFTLLRIYFFIHFHPAGYSFSNCLDALLLGLRFDLRTVGILVFPVLLFGSMYITKSINKRLTAGSFLLIITIILVTAVGVLFLKNNKAGTIAISLLILLSCLIIVWLILSKSLNPFKNPNAAKIWRTYLIIVSSVVLLFYVLDFQHFDYLHQRLNASVLNYTQDAKISFSMVWQTYPVIKILFSLLILIWLILWIINRTFKTSFSKIRSYKSGTFATVILSLLFVLAIFGRVSQYPLRWSDAFSFGDDFKANLALNPIQSFFSSLQYRNTNYDLNKVKQDYSLLAAYLKVDQPNAQQLNFDRIHKPNTLSQKPNVIVVICESFSAYKSSMYGNPLNTTPYFNQLTQQGLFFDRCFTPAYGTARGVWAVVTGIPDVESPNTASRNPSMVDQHTIINDMDGYEKYYFLGGSTSWANIRGLLTNNISGLHLYEDGSYKAKSIDVWGISDKHLFLEASDILAHQNKPFFAVIQTSDNHRPYTIPDDDKKEFNTVNYSKDTLQKYGFATNEELNAFIYTDFCFKKFIESAKKETYFNNTVFVFVGDHGIRGDAGDMFPKAWTDFGITTQHVPLLFYAPSKLKPQRVSSTCSQVDLLPTVASMIGMPFTNTGMGKNLLDTVNSSMLRYPHHAFLFDPDVRQIGMMTDSVCFIKNLITNKEEFASSKDNSPVIAERFTDLKTLTEGWYETAKYLLSHNKKPVKH